MAKKKSTRKSTRKRAAPRRPSRSVQRTRTAKPDPLLAAMKDAESREVAGVRLDTVRAGDARVKRIVYPAGFRWSRHMKPISGTELCMHAHVGFLARGSIRVEYADGCSVEHVAPQVVVIEPGHDGWVVGRQPAVLIEIDFERETISRLGMPESHRHP